MLFRSTGLVVYYMAQAIFRIGLNWYITHRFYKGEESLGRQAQAAGARARELAKDEGGFFSQMKKEAAAAKQAPAQRTTSKRVTPPKNKPTGQTARNAARPPSTGKAGRPSGSGRPPKKK